MNKNELEQAIVTLYEGHYHYGVAALINSLIRAEFKGLIRIGYRGHLPPWITALTKLTEEEFIFNGQIYLEFVAIDSDMHFGYYKPIFLRNTLLTYESLRQVYYFDPDIVVNAPWPFFSDWVQAGVALCLDNCFKYLHRNHPWRKEWMKLAGITSDFICETDYYVNSGFIGLTRHDISILDQWITLTTAYREIGGNTKIFEKDGHRAFKGDQDLLNAAITVRPNITFSVIGTEGMGFTQPAYLMSHAVSAVKPWRKNYLIHLMKKGQKPDFADNAYIKYANHPIKVFSSTTFLIKQFNLKLSFILGRLIG